MGPDRRLPALLYPEMVDLEDCDDEDATWLQELLTAMARRPAPRWPPASWPVGPGGDPVREGDAADYKRVLEAMRAAEQSGRPAEEAIMAAAHG